MRMRARTFCCWCGTIGHVAVFPLSWWHSVMVLGSVGRRSAAKEPMHALQLMASSTPAQQMKGVPSLFRTEHGKRRRCGSERQYHEKQASHEGNTEDDDNTVTTISSGVLLPQVHSARKRCSRWESYSVSFARVSVACC